MESPPLLIQKNDSKYLTKLQIKKAQFLFENDYFIWNEAEMYLRYHDIFSNSNNSDILYENVCRTTRIVFNLIHDVHFGSTASNAAHLKFYEVLDAWGALSEYLKDNDKFPKAFLDWFESIFRIYEVKDESGEFIASWDTFLRLYLIGGLDNKDAQEAYNQLTQNKKIKLSFDLLVGLLKNIVISNDLQNTCHLLVPRMQSTIMIDQELKPPEEVLRNYDYEKNNLYSNLCDWKTYEVLNDKSEKLITNLKINNKVLEKNFYQYYDDEFKKGKVNLNTEQNIYEYCYRIEKEADFNNTNIGNLNECENNYNPQVENKIEFFNKNAEMEDKIRIKFNRSPYNLIKNKNNLCVYKEPTDSDSGTFQIDNKVLLRKQPKTAQQTKELKSRFSSSTNELNSSGSFKLCEFKKEFKRLPNDLSQSLSKSINTLDLLDKSKNDQLTNTSNHDLKMNKMSEAKTLARISLDKNNNLLTLAKSKKIINKTKEIKDSFSDNEIEYKKAQDKSSDDSNRSTKIEHVDALNSRQIQNDDFKKFKQLISDKKNIMRSETIRNNLLKELVKKTNININIDNDVETNSSNTNSSIIKAFMPRPTNKSLDEKLFSSSTSSTTNTSSSDSSSSSNSSNSSASSSSSSSAKTQTSSSATNNSSESDKNLYSRMSKGPNKTLKVQSINKMVFPFDLTDTKSSVKIKSQSSNQPSFSTMSNSSTTVSKVMSLNEKSCKSFKDDKDPDLNENKYGRNFQISSEFKNMNKLRNNLRVRASTPKQYPDEVTNKNRSPYSWPNQSLNNSFNQTDSNAKEKQCIRNILLRKTLDQEVPIENKSEKLINRSKLQNEFKVNRNQGISEPIKSIASALALSSFDTLNDIDSEEDQNIQDIEFMHKKEKSPSDSTIDSSFMETQLNPYDTEYFTNITPIQSNTNSNVLKRTDTKLDDWNYASSPALFSANDQRIMSEITRRLKPYLQKYIKKEIRLYLDRHLHKETRPFNRYDNKNLTKIGDF